MTDIEFNLDWYKKFIRATNEKNILASKISELIGNKEETCLEIGLGISPSFAKKLSKKFNKYIIVEKRIIKENMPKEMQLINADWEEVKIEEKFDIIIASHVIYYFKNKKNAVEKIINSLKQKGRAYFVVNGKSADYGPLKLFFSRLINTKYEFTYDKLIVLLKNRRIREYTVPSDISFLSYEDLFETMKLSFDTYPEEYEKFKKEILIYFKNNIRDNRFIIDQKIIEVQK